MSDTKIEISEETLAALNLIRQQSNIESDRGMRPMQYDNSWYYKKEYGDTKQHWIGPFSTRAECVKEYENYLDWMGDVDIDTPVNKLPV